MEIKPTMSTKKNNFVEATLKYYEELCTSQNQFNFNWSPNRKRFTLSEANALFVGIMLDQGQKAERAWDGGRHLVANHFQGNSGFWENIARSRTNTIKKICITGHNGKSYASVFCTNKFPLWLQSAAHRMLEKYDGDPRNIWNVPPEQVCKIYDRFLEFDGIGDALAKMAQFILVRNYGVAGGQSNQSKMSVKPDILVRRVLARSGISSSENLKPSLEALAELKLDRPADFDAAIWYIGRNFCLKSQRQCTMCPIDAVCEKI